MKQKYIIVKQGNFEVPIIFPELMQHGEVGRGYTIISAGFMRIYPESEDVTWLDVSCFGKSVSLNLESRGQVDADLIKRMMFKD